MLRFFTSTMTTKRQSSRLAAQSSTNDTAVASNDVETPQKKQKTDPTLEVESKPVENDDAKSLELQVGDEIPDLVLLDEDENEVDLKKVAASTKYLVIFAYPKASTPGCTRQVCGFQKNFQFLKDSNTTVFGISSDSPKAQKNFITKQGLEYSLLSDPSKKLIGPLGAKKLPLGIKRSHWIFVDMVLKVKLIGISPEVSINSAKEEIENFIKKEKLKELKGEGKEEQKNDLKDELKD